MPDTRCEHDMLPGQCDWCKNPEASRTGTKKLAILRRQLAQYDGTCPRCGTPIVGGEDYIQLTEEDDWICQDH